MAAENAGKGFGNSNTKNYETLFEKIEKKADGKQQTLAWYRNNLQTMAKSYDQNPERMIRDEKADSKQPIELQDHNELRKHVKKGHLYFFSYEAKSKWLPYYDRFPLAYVLKRTNTNEFYAANLHYIKPKQRIKVIQKLNRNLIDIPRKIIHKYLNSHVDGLFLDLSQDEWESAVLLPVENFRNGKFKGRLPYDRNHVWEEMQPHESNRIKAKVVVKDY